MSHRSNGHCELKPIAKIKLRLLAPSVVLYRLNNLGIIPSFINGRRRRIVVLHRVIERYTGRRDARPGKLKTFLSAILCVCAVRACILTMDLGAGRKKKNTPGPCRLPRETEYTRKRTPNL